MLWRKLSFCEIHLHSFSQQFILYLHWIYIFKHNLSKYRKAIHKTQVLRSPWIEFLSYQILVNGHGENLKNNIDKNMILSRNEVIMNIEINIHVFHRKGGFVMGSRGYSLWPGHWYSIFEGVTDVFYHPMHADKLLVFVLAHLFLLVWLEERVTWDCSRHIRY